MSDSLILPVDQYMLVIDADTSVAHDSLNRLISACTDDSKIIGICGETKLENENESWWTMIQGKADCLFPDSPKLTLIPMTSLRVLHLASYGQGVREHVRLRHLLAWMVGTAGSSRVQVPIADVVLPLQFHDVPPAHG